MGSQGPGRKRITNRNTLTAEEDALNIIAKQAEVRLAAKRAARAEAREIRMKELERQQKEENSERYTVHSQRHGSLDLDTVGALGESNDYDDYSTISSQGSLYEDSFYSNSQRFSTQASEYSGVLGLSSRTSSRVNSSCAGTMLDDTLDGDFLEKDSSQTSNLSVTTLTSLGSCRGSGDSTVTADTETVQEIKEIHELKDQIQDVEAKYMQSIKVAKNSLVEMEEKYRKAMVSNAQLDNEKTNLIYQVDILKDSLMQLEELLAETRKESEEKSKHLEREKHAYSVLLFQFNDIKETLKQSEDLLTEIHQLQLKQDGHVREISDLQETIDWKNKKIGALERQKEYSDAIRNERDELRDEVVQLKDILKKHGIVFGSELSTNKDVEDDVPNASAGAEIQQGNSVLEIRLRKLVDERENLVEQVKRLKEQIEQGKKEKDQYFQLDGPNPEGKVIENGINADIMEMQRDTNRQISDLKFKLDKSEQEVTALEQNVLRLEGQVARYKSAAENAEKVEDELKTEKRKLQRELRSAMDKIEEMEASNSHLTKRLEKMKANRGMAASP